jgi:hypothetical protein
VKGHEVHDALDGLCQAMIEEFDGPPAVEAGTVKKEASRQE